MGAGKPTTPALDATLPFLNALDDAPAGAADPLIGARLKHFQVKKLLGKGGMGAVYLAEDTSLGRQVALKVLDRAVGADPEIVARFVREARAQAQLRHPNITQIYFIGEEGGVHFFAMEFLDGEPLDARLARGEVLPWDQAISVCEAAARGLEVACAVAYYGGQGSPPRSKRASSTATSSRRTCSSTARARSSWPTSGSPRACAATPSSPAPG